VFKTFFFAKHNKRSPIKTFLDKSDEGVRTKTLRQLKYVQEFGLTPAIRNIKKLKRTPLWELRILGKDNIRIICAALPNEKIVVLHIFSKKKQKTPKNEIAVALQRYRETVNYIDK
jgi:phage-related protein